MYKFSNTCGMIPITKNRILTPKAKFVCTKKDAIEICKKYIKNELDITTNDSDFYIDLAIDTDYYGKEFRDFFGDLEPDNLSDEDLEKIRAKGFPCDGCFKHILMDIFNNPRTLDISAYHDKNKELIILIELSLYDYDKFLSNPNKKIDFKFNQKIEP